MRYVLYARKSSEEKNRQVQSIEDQIAALQPLIDGDRLDVTHVLTESRSAKAPGRPVFAQMLDLIQKGEADAILCWHLNRLTRNEIDSGTIRWMLRQGMIKEIRTPHRTYRPEDNALITAVESAMGEQFIVELKQSTRRGVLSKIEKGWFPGRVPQGYQNEILTHTIGRDPERWVLIRRAWQEMLTGTKTVPQIATMMTDEWGYRPRGVGKGMPRNTLYNIFNNRFYTGTFEFEKTTYQGKHEPMVTPAEFEVVQRLLGKATPKKRNRKHEFAYSGLIRCGCCGRTVCGDRKKKVLKNTGEEVFHTYYVCSQGSRCKSGWLKEKEIDERIAGMVRSLALPESFLTYAREVTAEWRAEERQAESAMRASQARTLADTERQLDELLSLRLGGLIDDETFQKRQQTLKTQRTTVLENAQKTARAVEQSWETVENVAEFCVRAEEVFRSGTLADKAFIAHKVGVSFVLKDEKLDVDEGELLGLVRVHNEKIAASPGALEPLENGTGSRESGELVGLCSGWGSLLNAIRTKAVNDGLYFGNVFEVIRLSHEEKIERIEQLRLPW